MFGDFVVHVHCVQCRAIRNLKRVQKGTSTGVRTANVLLCKWSERPGFSWFLPNSVLWRQNLAEILFLFWLAFWRKLTWKSIPWGDCQKKETKTQNLTWPKARISTFSEWTSVDLVVLVCTRDHVPADQTCRLGKARFCQGNFDILPQNFARSSSIFCFHFARSLDILLPFCSNARPNLGHV